MDIKTLPLTEEQLNSWHQNGFLILKNVLTDIEKKDLKAAVDDIVEKHENGSEGTRNTKKSHGKEYYNIHNPFDYTDQLDYLIDHPKVFDVVTYLMGPYIQAMSCHVFVRHPNDGKNTNIAKFHTDSGPALQRILPTEYNLPLQLKFQYFLTDMPHDYMSNFIAIPGSHVKPVNYHHPYCLVPQCNAYLDRNEMPPDAIQLKVNAGDVLIHTLTLWHAVAPNLSAISRKSISIRYGQMWFKNYYSNLNEEIIRRQTERRKRLLGDYGENNSGDIAYRPPADQVEMMLGDNAAAFGWPNNFNE